MVPEQALKRLLGSLQLRDISLTEDDVGWAFEAKTTRDQVTTWVRQYLGDETFLSHEELKLYSLLEKNGVVKRITANHDLDTVNVFFDEDIETAISSLEGSTSAFLSQTRKLTLQREAQNAFHESSLQARRRYEGVALLRQRNRLQEKQSTDLAVEELSQILNESANFALLHSKAQDEACPKRTIESFHKDDSLLQNIDKLAKTSCFVYGDDECYRSRTQDLVTKLRIYKADQIRCYLDFIYLEAVQSSRRRTVSDSNEDIGLLSLLKAELNTLYPEINAVAQISTTQAFEVPLALSIDHDIDCREDQIRSVLGIIDATLSHLQEKADDTIRRLQAHDSHVAALNVFLHEVDMSNRVIPREKLEAPPENPNSIIQEAKPQSAAESGHHQLLQSLGLPPLEMLNSSKIQATLDSVICDRELKSKEGLRGLNQSIDSLLIENLSISASTNNLIFDGLLEDTEFNNIELSNARLRSRTTNLEAEIGEIGSDMASLDMKKLSLASAKRDDFLKNWAS